MKTCTRCGRAIAGVVGDPVHVTSLGTFHEQCMAIAHREADEHERRRREEARERRSAAARARFEAGNPFAKDGSS